MNCYNCSVSFDLAQRLPMVLTTCGHTICTQCIQDLTRNDSITCPECGGNTGNVPSLPTNTALLACLPKRKPLGEVTISASSQCRIHGKTLEAYCLEDLEVLCVMCVVENQHTSHRLMPIDAAADRERDWLKGLFTQTEIAEKNAEKTEIELENAKIALKKAYEQAQSDIISFYKTILEHIKNRQMQKLANLSDIYTREKSNLETKKSQNSRQKELISELKATCRPAKQKNNIDLLRTSKLHKSLSAQVFSKPGVTSLPFHFPLLQKETEVTWLVNNLKTGINSGKTTNSGQKTQEVGLTLAQSHLMFSKNLRSNEKENVQKRQGSCMRLRSYEKVPTVAISVEALGKETPSSTRSREAIYTFGGAGLYTVEKTELVKFTSSLVTAMKAPRASFGAVACDNVCVTVIGGTGSGESEETVLPLAMCKPGNLKLVQPREGFGLVLLQQKLYIFGGVELGLLVDKVEVGEDSTWKTVSRLSAPAANFGYCSDNKATFYVAGGTLTSGLSSQVHSFDSATLVSTELPSLSTPRAKLALVHCNSSLYSIGGFNGSAAVAVVECLQLGSLSWTCISPLSAPRCSLSAVVSQNGIICLGGFGTSAVDVIEEYSLQTSTWRVAGRLATARFQHVSLVMPDSS